MRLSAFIDSGNVYDNSSNFKIDELRMSAGIGFAYLSPIGAIGMYTSCLLYTSPSPRDRQKSRMPSSA